MKSGALLPSNLPSVIDRSNLSPSRFYFLNIYLPTFSSIVGVDDSPLRIHLGVIGSDNNFHIILYFSKDFEEV